MPRDCAILREINISECCIIDPSNGCNDILCPYASKHYRWRNGTKLYKPERVQGPTAAPMKVSKRSQPPRSVRFAVFDRDGHECLRCGSREKLTYDHIVPFSKGGDKTLENGQTLCSECNGWKGSKTMDFRKASRSSSTGH